MSNSFSSLRFCLLIRVEENFLSGKLFLSTNAFFCSLILCKPPSHKGFRELKEAYLQCHSPKNKAKPSQKDLIELEGKSLRPTKWDFSCRIFSSVKNAMNLQNYLNQFFFLMKIHGFSLLWYTLSPALDIIIETMWIKIDKVCNLE